MEIIILHQMDECLRYIVVKGKERNKTMTFYSYFLFKSTQRLEKRIFLLHYWEIDKLQEFFSIYN